MPLHSSPKTRRNLVPFFRARAAAPPRLQRAAAGRGGARESAADYYGVERQTNKLLYFRAFVTVGADLKQALRLRSSNLRVGNSYKSAAAAARAHDRWGFWRRRGARWGSGAVSGGGCGAGSGEC